LKELKAGIVGFGYTGRLHLEAYGRNRVHVAGAADPNREVLATVPLEIRRFEDFRDLLRSDIDIVSICTPTTLHCEQTLAALFAGKHVLLEKPIAATSADAARISAAEKLSGKRVLVGMTHRFYPEILAAKRIVEDDGIGEVVMARDCILEHFGFVNSPRWYLQPELAGGGTVLSSGVHLADRVLWFLGEMPESVSGYLSNRFLNQPVEDAAQMTLGFPSGRFAQITFGLLPEPHPLVCDLELIGTRGSVVVHTWSGFEVRTAAGTRQHAVYTTETHREKVLVGVSAEVKELCGAILEGGPPRPSSEESALPIGVIEAFYRAAKSGTVAKVDR
jgi:UDP-N-acetyl-2-amino-2-deoxyglucuronate dehydrogenase